MNNILSIAQDQQYSVIHQAALESIEFDKKIEGLQKLEKEKDAMFGKAKGMLFWQIALVVGTWLVIIQLLEYIIKSGQPEKISSIVPISFIALLPAMLIPARRFFIKRNSARYGGEAESLLAKYEVERINIGTYLNQTRALMMIPEDYRNTHALTSFVKYFENGRAESYKEAVEIYMIDIHRQTMEQQNQQILELQKDILDETKKAKRAASAAAAASMYNAFRD